MSKTCVLLSVAVWCCGLPVLADEPISPEAELIVVAKEIRSPAGHEVRLQQLNGIKAKLQSHQGQLQRFAELLEAFDAMGPEGDVRKAETLRLAFAKQAVSAWEQYLAVSLRASIESRMARHADELESIEWLIVNLGVLEDGKKNSGLCAALVEGLEKGKGPFVAGLLVSKAGILAADGKEAEAETVYETVLRDFPETLWAISARNRLNHLRNKQAIAEIMNEKHPPAQKSR